jgi:hypothetical protein
MVTSFLQSFSNVVALSVKAIEDWNSVSMGILSGQEGRPTRRAYRIRYKGIQESRAFPSQPIEMRCFIHSGTIRRNGVLRVIVRKDKQDVGPFSRQSDWTEYPRKEYQSADLQTSAHRLVHNWEQPRERWHYRSCGRRLLENGARN